MRLRTLSKGDLADEGRRPETLVETSLTRPGEVGASTGAGSGMDDPTLDN
jgi:hypothetical protein